MEKAGLFFYDTDGQRLASGDLNPIPLYKGMKITIQGVLNVRPATIRTLKALRFLALHKKAFVDSVMIHPEMALGICEVLSKRLREFHSLIPASSKSATTTRM